MSPAWPGLDQTGGGGLGRTQTTSTILVATRPCSSSSCLIFPHWVKPAPPRAPQAPLAPSLTFLLAESRLPVAFRPARSPQKHQQRGWIHIICFNPSEHRPWDLQAHHQVWGFIHRQGGMRTRMAGDATSKERVLEADVKLSAGWHLDRCDVGFSCTVCRLGILEYFDTPSIREPSNTRRYRHKFLFPHLLPGKGASPKGSPPVSLLLIDP